MQIGGLGGAIAATIGIFLPSFVFVALLNPVISWLRGSVNMVAIGIILTLVIQMGSDSITDWRTILIAALGFTITLYFRKLNTAFVVVGGALLGYFLQLF